MGHRRMTAITRVLSLALLFSLASSVAHADRFPTLATDGLFVGVRLDPGGALSFTYDLDVYLTGDRLMSLGPAISIAFLSEEGADAGRRQDWLLSLDILRYKVDVLGGDEEVRLCPFVGVGMYFAQLPAQQSAPREVILEDGTPAIASVVYDPLMALGAMLSVGVEGDYFFTDWLGIAVSAAVHFRLSDEERIPIAWSSVDVGLRFGL